MPKYLHGTVFQGQTSNTLLNVYQLCMSKLCLLNYIVFKSIFPE